ncbi:MULTISPECIES: helix-turn-helix transcriptional regulator [unclassified Spirosoma]|uniref:helix-turn-helix transcriptional regulator n=1 Tax=unclassified Spirosoma TaxID=2621999 RepID=UPI000967BC82|nr:MULTISPECIES: helix-turn-helix transcriptional regulator [unclassified Spirosoma]MBN8823928.1 hypothetical protein [Spirosoma sp.]OJW79680.1 MAG: hypothetical protein BGO59_00050 [Spirosoma sp. 48-14]
MARVSLRLSKNLSILLVIFTYFHPENTTSQPILRQLAQAAPARRVVITLNYFDTCYTALTNQGVAFTWLDQFDSLGSQVKDQQLKRYVRFIRDSYTKNGNKLSNPQKAELFVKAAQEAEQEGDEQMTGVCEHFAGEYYFLAEAYGQAFEYLLLANNRFRKIGYETVPAISRYLYELGLIYYHFKEYGKAIEMFQESARYPAFNPSLALQVHNALGLAYLKISQLQNPSDVKRAEQSFQKALQVAKANKDQTNQANLYGNLSKIYLHQQRLPLAIAALKFDYSLHLNAEKGNLPDQATLSLARAYLLQHQLDSCAYFLGESAKFHQRNQGSDLFGENLKNENYRRLYCDVARQYYQAVNNLPKAYWYLDSMARLDEQINKRYNSEQISLVEQKLLIQKHQLEVSALRAKHDEQQFRVWAIATMLVITSALFFRLYQLTQRRRRQEALANTEREKRLQLEKQRAVDELERARTDLTVFIENLRQKDTLIDTINADLERLPQAAGEPSQIMLDMQHNLLNASLLTNEDWDEFRRRFERVFPYFFTQLHTQFKNLTPAEERLMALSKLKIDTRQMSRMLGISPSSVRTTKYRLRRRLGIDGQSQLDELLDA